MSRAEAGGAVPGNGQLLLPARWHLSPLNIMWYHRDDSRPVQIGKYLLLDGGISDPIPYRYMESKGYDRNVLILTQPAGYRKQRSSSLMLRMLHNYPEIARAMARRHMVYNRQLDQIREREISGQSYVIRPPEDLKIGHIEKNPEELERVYQTGRHTAEEQIGRIREFLDTGR